MDSRRLTDAQHQQAYAAKHGHFVEYKGQLPPAVIVRTPEKIQGTFHEFAILDELKDYVGKTYSQHYAKDGVQAFSLIAKRPERGLGFAVGNILKYADRYGVKAGANRDDLLKVAHYAILALYCDSQLSKPNDPRK